MGQEDVKEQQYRLPYTAQLSQASGADYKLRSADEFSGRIDG